MESSTTPKRGVDAATIAEAFRLTAEQRADQVAVRTKGGAVSWTWGELRDRVDRLAGSLSALGLRKGDTIALMLGNRPEFHQADLAAMMVGATPFSIYMTYAPNQIEYVVQDAGAKIIVTEQQFLDNVLEARKTLPGLAHVIVVDGDAVPEGVTRLDDLPAADFDVDASVAALGPEDVLTLIYTSGTTGPPKGVELVHRNLLSAVSGIEEIVQFPDGARVISWLPNAHIAERAAHHYLPIVFGFQVTCCPNPRDIIAFLPEVRPHWFFAVPRIWEKLKSGLEAMIAGQQPEQQQASRAAVADGLQKVRLEQAGEEVPAALAERVAQADAAMFAGLRSMLGLDEVVAINVGAAPTPVEVLEFFHAIGLPLGELWGMSETCGGGAVNPPQRIKIGTVGPATPGCELKLADDGELLIRGGLVMAGYRGLPDKTAEAIDAEGWLHTGDIAQIDGDGYVKIVDRKKEIIINAAGKNMSPANIEATIKSASPLIGNAVCIGDARPYNTALIVLDADFAPAWAAQNGIEGATLESLSHDERVRAAIQEGIDGANAKLARVEQIKKFVIVEGDWLPGGDELTPTMKLKRKPIAEKYDRDIAGMYTK
ncbi:MAG TPA: AMP-dependent synthetase/ligase [Baekduia sp.]|uniref:AMP-dependent synthetase/ligase n=1 Tax=Baekduia sp. TaxID=2600305 RepID=UPI002D1BDD35|nr:AMP-dependent synthetase/ligase [Baekduia sp.]HMJ36941.1 AMP-dependent synthetase/ligase [Baekduia sp.]